MSTWHDPPNPMSVVDYGHPSHIVCPCTYGRPQDCGFNQRVEPFVPYIPAPRVTQDQIREWQEQWQRITQPKPRPRPWRGICPPIRGAGQR